MWPRCDWIESYGRDNAGVGKGGGGSNDGVCYVVIDCLIKAKISLYSHKTFGRE